MSKFHFEACDKNLARRVFGVPGSLIIYDELGFAVNFERRASTFCKRFNPTIVFHTVDRLVPVREDGSWVNYLEGYDIPEITRAVSDGLGEPRVLLGQYEFKDDGLLHFYVFSHQGKPYFEAGEHYDADLPFGIYVVDLRYGTKREAEGFNACYEQSLVQSAVYYRSAAPNQTYSMKVFNIFVIPMGYQKDGLKMASASASEIVATYQEIYRQFLAQ